MLDYFPGKGIPEGLVQGTGDQGTGQELIRCCPSGIFRMWMLGGNLKKMGEEGQSDWGLEKDTESVLAKGRGVPLLLGFFRGVVVAADTWAPLICKGTGFLGCPG